MNINAVPAWLRRPFPAVYFSLANLFSPAVLPALAFLVLSHSYYQRQTDRATAIKDPYFMDPSNYDEFDFIVGKQFGRWIFVFMVNLALTAFVCVNVFEYSRRWLSWICFSESAFDKQ